MAAWKCLEDSQCLEGSQWLESKKSAGGREKWKYVHQQDRAGQGRAFGIHYADAHLMDSCIQ